MPFLLITSLIWAFSFGLIKHHLAGVDPRFVAMARLLLSSLVFVPWLRPGRFNVKSFALVMGLGGLQFGLMYVFYLLAFRSLAAYQVALLTITTPIWVCLCENLIVRQFSLRP